MNFLAHSMISLALERRPNVLGGDTLFGNFAGDFYKGQVENLEVDAPIKNGVILHRFIDRTTDRRDNFLGTLLAGEYGIFKGIVADIVIDHFVAKQFNQLFGQDILAAEQAIMARIASHQAHFPQGFAPLFDWLNQNHALSNYADVDFLESRVFSGLAKRVSRGGILLSAADSLKQNYPRFEQAALQEFAYVQEESLRAFG
ncbi:ACP phosphodiesterase [Neisseria perflava]|uniref:ACP phosphodiesterase n=1 Tax=Neisseria perflava TaxID=33053 RepID=UPI00209D3276|nr:ACP phosphodiesterase [Neisseria perflava]MCP1659425.1 acyl carrier protein phosphodiesterase [Neisseria perflava]MCP1772265.1 acyl carrier protein phosphodiesterase [Neisseria perflava]